MKETKHTPGPWRIADLGRSDMAAVEGPDGIFVCHLDRPGVPEQRDANARLIQTAPELLEECKVALNYLENITLNGLTEPSICYGLRTAIDKAEGR